MSASSLESRIRQQIFADPDQEILESAVGKPQLMKYLQEGKLSNPFAVLSNYSVYCKGRCLVRKKGVAPQKRLVEYRIDISEISDIRHVRRNPSWLLTFCYFFLILAPALMLLELLAGFGSSLHLSPILGMLVCLMLAGIFALIYFLRKKVYLQISYTNGSVSLDSAFLPEAEEHAFVAQLKQQLAAWDEYVERQQYNQTYNRAYNQAFNQAYQQAFSEGYNQGSNQGYQYGYQQGSYRQPPAGPNGQ